MSKVPKPLVIDELYQDDFWEMDLEEQILADLDHEFREDVNRSWRWYMTVDKYRSQGWTMVTISKNTDNNHAIDIRQWLADNHITDVVNEATEFLFKNRQDATLFALRWV